MYPVLVRVLPPSVRRGYYELVDYQLPLLFSTYWIHRAIYRVKWLLSPSFRREQRELAKQMELLTRALSAGFLIPAGEAKALVVEDLRPVMQLVTFDASHLKARR